MNAEQLLARYEHIADAPDAVGRLRAFILDLAVRGKLVPQNPNDEPASALLKRIAKERAGLDRDGRIKQQNLFPEPDLDEVPFEIPATWVWARFPELGKFGRGKSKHRPRNDPALFEGGKHPMIQTGDVARSKGRIKTFTNKYNDLGLSQSLLWPRGTLCITIAANIADSGILSFDACFPDSVVGFIPESAFENARYFEYFLRTAKANLLEFAPATAQKNINLDILTQVLIPLPPLAEQCRIVAKVDELMTLCDRLEAARAEREATPDRFTRASFSGLNNPDDGPAAFVHLARFAVNNLAALTARPGQIKHLRQAILNLAVRGQLVPQHPNDEPVRIPGSSNDEKPDGLPPSWSYTKLESLLSEDTRNGYSRKPDDAVDGVPILRISAGTVRQDGFVAEEEHKLIGGIDTRTRIQYGLTRGDLLACRFNGNRAFVGRFTIFTDYLGIQPIFPDKLIRVRLRPEMVTPFYVRIASDTDVVRNDVESFCATTVGNWGISASNLRAIRFAVPPLAEQHRIVTKVDELMALCDKLEAALSAGDVARRGLLDALLAEALKTVEMAARLAAE
jgi:type I restriction enzyme, S subunit